MAGLQILTGDCRAVLPTLEAGSVQCCVTSPPYWGLRDFDIGDQLGLEQTPEEYIAKMVAVFREVWRVLRDDGTLWVNMGDSYASNGACGGGSVFDKPTDGRPEYGGKNNGRPVGRESDKSAKIKIGGTAKSGLKPKDLCMMPARVALALQADGWWVRSDIIWHKLNSMPESVTDRPTKTHEYIFLLTKSERYYYDAAAIAEPANAEAISDVVHANGQRICSTCKRPIQRERTRQSQTSDLQSVGSWASNTQEVRQVREGASLPAEISSKPETQECTEAALRKRQTESDHRSLSFDAQGQGIFTEGNPQTPRANGHTEHVDGSGMVGNQNGTQQRVRILRENGSAINSRSCDTAFQRRTTYQREYCSCVPELQRPQRQPLRNRRTVWEIPTQPYPEAHFATFPEEIPKLCILAGSKPGDLILDPFGGSGTVAKVALELGRRAVLIELNPDYIELVEDRTLVTPGFF